MSKVSDIKSRQSPDICQFCGEEPDHKGFWACPRLSSVSMDPDGAWAVEFVEPEIEIEFIPEEAEDCDDDTKSDKA